MPCLYCLRVGEEYFYYGSTLTTMERRIIKHKKSYYENRGRKLYQKIREVGGWRFVKVEIIRTLPDDASADTLREAEQELVGGVIRNDYCLNMRNARKIKPIPVPEHI